jgi:hypothetical protein
MLQLIEDAPDVFVRYSVVTGLAVVLSVSVHVRWRAMRLPPYSGFSNNFGSSLTPAFRAKFSASR